MNKNIVITTAILCLSGSVAVADTSAAKDPPPPGATVPTDLMVGASLGTYTPTYKAPKAFWTNDVVGHTFADAAAQASKHNTLLKQKAPHLKFRLKATNNQFEAAKQLFQTHAQELSTGQSKAQKLYRLEPSKSPDLYQYSGDGQDKQ